MNKHGIPGIGVTAPQGKKGMQGNSFHFGNLASFFRYIGDDILLDSSIDYEDVDYDITYVQNEKRLDPKYKVGDILFITDSSLTNSLVDDTSVFTYMVEITEDMTTCTESYFLEHTKYERPFTIKYTLDDHTFLYPINIVKCPPEDPGDQGSKRDKANGIYASFDLYYDSMLNLAAYYPYINIENIQVDNDISVLREQYTYNRLPYMYFNQSAIPRPKRQEIIDDGSNIYKFNYLDVSNKFIGMVPDKLEWLNLYANQSTHSSAEKNLLQVYTSIDKYICINVQNNKLFFENLYIKNNNIGNVDAYHTLYNPYFALDNDGNCYTLTESDYNTGMQGFVIDTSKFLNNRSLKDDSLTIDDFNYGYCHMYWNNTPGNTYNYYKPNHIRGRFLSTEKKNMYVIRKDQDGNYIRNWNDEKFKAVENLEIKDILVNTYETQTLMDVSYLVSADNPDLMDYLDVSGIIMIQDTSNYVYYDKIQSIDLLSEFHDYGDVMLYVDVSEGGTTKRINYKTLLTVTTVDESASSSASSSASQIAYITTNYYDPSPGLIAKYIDTSYYSGIDYQFNPKNNVIPIDMLDPTGKYYFNHQIIQWIQDPNGLRYFSKVTKATYNMNTLSFDIDADWKNTNMLAEDEKMDKGYPEISCDIQVKNEKVYVDLHTESDQQFIKSVNSVILENSVEIEQDQVLDGIYVYNSHLDLSDIITYADVIATDADKNILNDIFNNTQQIIIEPAYAIYEIQYTMDTLKEKNAKGTIVKQVMLNNFKDYRTLPEVNLIAHTDMESLERYNDIDNGVLCNQFQYFIDVDVKNFDYSNWGQMQEWYNEGVLINIGFNFKYKLDTISSDLKLQDIITVFKLQTIVTEGDDVTNMSWKELYQFNKNSISINVPNSNHAEADNTFTRMYSINDIVSKTIKFRVVLETSNPEIVKFDFSMVVNSLSVIALSTYTKTTIMSQLNGGYDGDELNQNMTGIVYTLNPKYLIYYDNKYDVKYRYSTGNFIGVIAPISYIAGYDQKFDKTVTVNNCLQGSDDYVKVAIKPYMLEEAEALYDNYTQRPANMPNWNTYKFKRRFLQDNIKSINVYPININDIYEKLVIDTQYSQYNDLYLVSDPDNKYDTYLELIYDATKYNSRLIEDQEQFVYNQELLLSSKYSQQENNSAVLIRQETDYEVRSNTLLNSIQLWNKEYLNYHYDSDNPFRGHLQLYGNGYQYLPNYADNGMYLKDGFMSLSDVRELNNKYFFDTDDTEAYSYVINQPDKEDAYTPTKLFRQLVTQMKWIYPLYYSADGINLVREFELCDNVKRVTGTLANTQIPYNLLYSIYPRVMFNDEEQEPLILMLRRPSIINENQYEMTTEDLQIDGVNEVGSVTSPLNVLN